MVPPYSIIRKISASFWKCKIEGGKIHDIAFLLRHFKKSMELCGTKVIKIINHEFNPQGITIIAILSDSHAVIHTWPEYNFIMVDILTCGKQALPSKAIDYLKSQFNPNDVEISQEVIKL